MKKFTSLLLLLLLCFVGGVNSAYADDAEGWKGKYIKSVSEAITSLDNLTDGFYLFRQDGKKRFLYENRAENGGIISTAGDGPYDYKEGQLLIRKVDNSAGNVASFKSSFEGLSKDMLSYVVRVTKNTDGTFKMQFRSGKYMPNALNVGWAADAQGGNGDDRRVFTTEKVGAIEFTYISETYFKFKGQGGDLYGEGWEGNDGVNGKFCGAADGGDIKYEIFPVTLADPQPVSCTFTAQDANGNVLATITQNEQEGEDVTNPFEYSYFYTPTFVESDLVASEKNHVFHVKFTEGEVPFQFSTAANPVWYTIHFRKTEENKYLRHVNAADEKISTTAFSDNNGYPSFCGGLWAFVRDGLGVKLLCKQTGTYVTVNNANNGQAAKLDANGMAFIVMTNSSDPNASDPSVSSTGFSLKYPGVDKAYLGDHASGLGIWTPAESWADSQNDAGSCYQIALADVNDIVNIGKESFDHNTAVNEAQGNFLTAGSNDAAVQAAKEAAQSATTLAQLDAAYEKLTRYAYPEANAYYRIKNVSTSEYVHTDNVEVGTDGNLANNVDVERSASSTNLVGQLWQFEADGNGKYYVKNANSGRYFSNETDKHIYLATEANEATAKGSFTFKAFPSVNTEDTNIKLQLRLNDENRINAFQGVYDKYLQNWDADGDTDGGGYWTFEKVTSITVKILETGWTSVCYPFAVTIPSDSEVKAYYAEKPTTDGLQLTEVEGNVIPANQGVFLVNMEGATTVNLEITNGATATLDNNLLSGATAKRTGFAGSDTYLLGLSDNSKSPALLKSTLTWVPANKAYFLASKLANGINVLSLTFGQNTGINEAAANAAKNETYYDLNGRVVLYPQHGIFVTKSGRKVYVK